MRLWAHFVSLYDNTPRLIPRIITLLFPGTAFLRCSGVLLLATLWRGWSATVSQSGSPSTSLSLPSLICWRWGGWSQPGSPSTSLSLSSLICWRWGGWSQPGSPSASLSLLRCGPLICLRLGTGDRPWRCKSHTYSNIHCTTHTQESSGIVVQLDVQCAQLNLHYLFLACEVSWAHLFPPLLVCSSSVWRLLPLVTLASLYFLKT